LRKCSFLFVVSPLTSFYCLLTFIEVVQIDDAKFKDNMYRFIYKNTYTAQLQCTIVLVIGLFG